MSQEMSLLAHILPFLKQDFFNRPEISIAAARKEFEIYGLRLEDYEFPHLPENEFSPVAETHHAYFERLEISVVGPRRAKLHGTYVHQARCGEKVQGVWTPAKAVKQKFEIPVEF